MKKVVVLLVDDSKYSGVYADGRFIDEIKDEGFPEQVVEILERLDVLPRGQVAFVEADANLAEKISTTGIWPRELPEQG